MHLYSAGRMSKWVTISACAVVLFGCGALYESVVNRSLATDEEHVAALDACADCDEIRSWFIADLHADSFLAGRDPATSYRIGHLDLRRLQEAGVDFQVFAVPNQTPGPRTTYDPLGECIPRDGFDRSAQLLGPLTGRHPSSKALAFDQARLFCGSTNGVWSGGEWVNGAWTDGGPPSCSHAPARVPVGDAFFAIETAADLKRLIHALENREYVERPPVGALLALEGLNWIEGDATSDDVAREIAELKNAGFRMIGLTHRHQNALGSSDEACEGNGGLTPLGQIAAQLVLDNGLLLDVAHLSAKGVMNVDGPDATSIAAANTRGPSDRAPILMSHGGVKGLCRELGIDQKRNLPDDHIRRLMELRAPFGVIHWMKAYCVPSSIPADVGFSTILHAYDHAYHLDPNHAPSALALGSDFDGAIPAPYDIRAFPLLLSRMRRSRWCLALEAEECDAFVQRLAGENVKEFLLDTLP